MSGRLGDWRRLLSRLVTSPIKARVALNLAPRDSPYGGGNQFVAQLVPSLRRLGFEIVYELTDSVDVVLIIEARDHLASFALSEVERWRARRTQGIVIHRVNECDRRKGTSTMDAELARANRLADHTVFLSSWLLEYHQARWFDRTHPASVVRSGADSRVFHPLRASNPDDGVFRVATHHWSDHAKKGFPVYQEIDRAIAAGDLPGFELMIIGRWPKDIQWRAARTFGPATGDALGNLLRRAHGYVTASLWEPGGMHVAEALQCGLPVAYHRDGGGLVEQAGQAGVGFQEDVLAALRELRARNPELRRQALSDPPSGELMCLDYARLIHRLLAQGRVS